MGIPQFYKKIKKDYPESIIERYDFDIYKTYDYIIFDFLSLIYSVYNLFSLEINYYIRILFYARYMYHSNNLEGFYSKKLNFVSIIKKILRKYSNYFNQIYDMELLDLLKLIDNLSIKEINFLLSKTFNNEEILIDTIIVLVLVQIKRLTQYHISSPDKYNRTWIFFDGVPSKAKIKEQMIRRIYPDILKYIKNNLYKYSLQSEVELDKKLLSDSPPSIGVNKPIVIKIHSLLSKINNSVKGKFNINDLASYGEAEHQIMNFLSQNTEKFSNKKLLLISPDADLILLSIIMRSRNIYIDIFKIDVENNIDKKGNDVLSARYIYAYIYPHKIIESLKLVNTQEELDISFLLLLLGDDFLPIIPNLSINSLKLIIDIYHKTQLPIINMEAKSIYYVNFIVVLTKLKDIYTPYKFDKEKLRRERDNLYNVKKIFLYNLYNRSIKSKFNLYKSYIFDRIYLLNKGVYVENKSLRLLLNSNKDGETSRSTQSQIYNYLEGCQFIFDIYINNTLRNYDWYYRYEKSPTLSEITSAVESKSSDELKIIFDYTKNSDNYYLTPNTYQRYIDYLKFVNIKDILKRLRIRENITMNNFQSLAEKYFTYNNIESIFILDNSKKFINKCINVVMINIPKKLTKIMS
jgi:hypothetical protein